MHLRDSGKGWFNIYETDYYVYSKSKLKKFLDSVKFCMQDALRYNVMSSINGFVKMIEDACIDCLNLNPAFEWSDDLRSSSILYVYRLFSIKPTTFPFFIDPNITRFLLLTW